MEIINTQTVRAYRGSPSWECFTKEMGLEGLAVWRRTKAGISGPGVKEGMELHGCERWDYKMKLTRGGSHRRGPHTDTAGKCKGMVQVGMISSEMGLIGCSAIMRSV